MWLELSPALGCVYRISRGSQGRSGLGASPSELPSPHVQKGAISCAGQRAGRRENRGTLLCVGAGRCSRLSYV